MKSKPVSMEEFRNGGVGTADAVVAAAETRRETPSGPRAQPKRLAAIDSLPPLSDSERVSKTIKIRVLFADKLRDETYARSTTGRRVTESDIIDAALSDYWAKGEK